MTIAFFSAFIFFAALLLGSSAVASLYIGAFFTVVMLPVLLPAMVLKWRLWVVFIASAAWIAAILHFPAMMGTFNYSAGTQRIYYDGLPEFSFAARVIVFSSIAAVASAFAGRRIFR